MTTGEVLFLILVFAAFAGFIIGLAVATTGAQGPQEPRPGHDRNRLTS